MSPLPRAIRALLRVPADYVDMHLSWQRRLLPTVTPLARGRLLDVGCGEKPFRELFGPHVDEYVGIEHEALFSLTDAARRESKPDFFYDGHTLPFEDASFDTVLNVDVLEHTEDPARVVSEMGRVLVDRGTLILTAPFSFRIHEAPHDYFRFSPHGLRVLCERAGLEVERVVPYGSLPSLIAHKLNSYLALRAARLDGVGQLLGKLPHEATRRPMPRLWALPLVIPAMLATASAARMLEHVVDDPSESLGFLIVARRRAR
jgi:SAM-dependent methyltransferase